MTSYNRRPERWKKAFRAKNHRRRRIHCTYCKRQLQKPTSPSGLALTRDHIVPKSAGGKRTVPCCRTCNNIKGNMMPDEWRRFTNENPEWWKSIERKD